MGWFNHQVFTVTWSNHTGNDDLEKGNFISNHGDGGLRSMSVVFCQAEGKTFSFVEYVCF